MALNIKLMGKKRGMTQIFDDKGCIIPCTVIEIEPNIVTQIKTDLTDGYNAIQTGCGEVTANDPRQKELRTPKPQRGHFKKAGVEPCKVLAESRVSNPEEYTLGQKFDVSLLKDVAYVDVRATSIGKGFQGAMKLHHFKGLPASHGTKKGHRGLGSTGNRSTPGRCLPGRKRAAHMGNKPVTTQSLKVVEVIQEDNLVLLKGSVPGPRNGLVTITTAIKKIKK